MSVQPEPLRVGTVVRAQAGAEGHYLFVRTSHTITPWYCINATPTFYTEWANMIGPEVLWEGPE